SPRQIPRVLSTLLQNRVTAKSRSARSSAVLSSAAYVAEKSTAATHAALVYPARKVACFATHAQRVQRFARHRIDEVRLPVAAITRKVWRRSLIFTSWP